MKIRFWGTHGSIVTLAEGKSVAVDLAPKIAVGINDENLLVILAIQFADHGLFRLFTAAGKGLDSPEAPTLLAGDLNDEVFFREERLFERGGVGRPMSALAGNDGVSLADPAPLQVRGSAATASGGKIRTAIRASDIIFLIIIISSLARR